MHRQDALSEYAREHKSHCTDFAHAVLQRADRNDLVNRRGPTRQECITYLEAGLVEREFREMV